MSARAIVLATALVLASSRLDAQARCAGRDVPRDAVDALADCLSDPNPDVRDGIAFDGLSKLLRSGSLEPPVLRGLKDRLIAAVTRGGTALQTSFPVLALAEVARTDRLKPWMTDAERDALVDTAARFLSTISDYRAFTQA